MIVYIENDTCQLVMGYVQEGHVSLLQNTDNSRGPTSPEYRRLQSTLFRSYTCRSSAVAQVCRACKQELQCVCAPQPYATWQEMIQLPHHPLSEDLIFLVNPPPPPNHPLPLAPHQHTETYTPRLSVTALHNDAPSPPCGEFYTWGKRLLLPFLTCIPTCCNTTLMVGATSNIFPVEYGNHSSAIRQSTYDQRMCTGK